MNFYLHLITFLITMLIGGIVYFFHSKEKNKRDGIYKFSLSFRLTVILMILLLPCIYLDIIKNGGDPGLLIFLPIIYLPLLYYLLITNSTTIYFNGDGQIIKKDLFSRRIFDKSEVTRISYSDWTSQYTLTLKDGRKVYLSDGIIGLKDLIRKIAEKQVSNINY